MGKYESFFKYSVNCRSRCGQVRFCSSHRSSWMTSEVVMNSLNIISVCYRPTTATSVFNLSVRIKVFHPSQYVLRIGRVGRYLIWNRNFCGCNRLRSIISSDTLHLSWSVQVKNSIIFCPFYSSKIKFYTNPVRVSKIYHLIYDLPKYHGETFHDFP